MSRLPGQTSEVWLGEEVALRIHPRDDRLLREAAIASRLAAAVRYPAVIASGKEPDFSWLVARRAPGIQLGRAWREMSAAERERAIHEVASVLAALHATPADGIPDDIEPPHTLPLPPLLALIDDLIATGGGDRALLAEVAAFAREKWDAFDDTGIGLVHGDPHLEYFLWDGEHV